MFIYISNSLAPGRFKCNFIYVILKWILVIEGWGIFCAIALIWMSLDFTDNQSTLVQVMAWCSQATSHYLKQCWPRSLPPNGFTRPQRKPGPAEQLKVQNSVSEKLVRHGYFGWHNLEICDVQWLILKRNYEEHQSYLPKWLTCPKKSFVETAELYIELPSEAHSDTMVKSWWRI